MAIADSMREITESERQDPPARLPGNARVEDHCRAGVGHKPLQDDLGAVREAGEVVPQCGCTVESAHSTPVPADVRLGDAGKIDAGVGEAMQGASGISP